ncbi:MAG: type 1 glutamine amidotransferase [Candidatus Omnitrophota bacterium]
MKFLIIKHIDIEGPGTLGDFLYQQGIHWDTLELGSGERLPQSPEGYDAVVALGGPMNVYEEDQYQFLSEEDHFIRECLHLGMPYLGFCLGSQLLAKAAGAKVVRSPVKEVGWYQVNLTDKGKSDHLFKESLSSMPVFHWHSDMFNVPQNGALLATGSGCPHQAFKVGSNAYGLQFHIEITNKNIEEWHNEYAASDSAGINLREMLDGYVLHKGLFHSQAEKIYQNFLSIVKGD